MNRLKAYHKFSVEVEFKTYADNGIILYNQQKSDGTGDFVSLAIVDGSVFVIFWISIVRLANDISNNISMDIFFWNVSRFYYRGNGSL